MQISFLAALIPGVDGVLVELFWVSITGVTLEMSEDGGSSVSVLLWGKQ